MKSSEYLGDVNFPWTPPPPYSPPTTTSPGTTPWHTRGRHEETVVTMEAETDLLDSVMSHNNEFIFRQTDKLGCLQRTVVTQIQDGNGQLRMSTIVDPGMALRSSGNATVRVGATVNFVDASGNIVMTTMENTNHSLSITSGNRVLGILDGCYGFFTNIVPRKVDGMPICTVAKDSSGAFHTFTSTTGSEIGRAGFLSGTDNEFSIKMTPGLDTTARSLLLVAAYEIFMLFYADTLFGQVGTNGTAWRCCMLILFVLVFIMLIVTIPTVLVLRGVYNHSAQSSLDLAKYPQGSPYNGGNGGHM